MNMRTLFGRILAGLVPGTPGCRTPEEVEFSVELRAADRPLTADEAQDAANVKAALGKARAERGRRA